MADGWFSPVAAGDVKKGGYVFLSKHPCKIMDIKVSKTGKHGHAKCNFTGVCVLTNKKFQDVQPSHIGMYAPTVSKLELQLMDVDEANGTVTLLDSNAETVTIPYDPTNEECTKLLEYCKNGNPDEYMVTVMKAPLLLDDEKMTFEVKEVVDSSKLGKPA